MKKNIKSPAFTRKSYFNSKLVHAQKKLLKSAVFQFVVKNDSSYINKLRGGANNNLV